MTLNINDPKLAKLLILVGEELANRLESSHNRVPNALTTQKDLQDIVDIRELVSDLKKP